MKLNLRKIKLPLVGLLIGINLFILGAIGWFSVSTQLQWPYWNSIGFSLKTWHYVLSSDEFYLTIIHSLHVAVLTALLSLFIGLPAAIGLSKMNTGVFKRILEVLMMAPLVTPPTVVYFGMYQMFLRLGLNDSILGVVISHTIATLPYMIWTTRIAYESLALPFEPIARSLGLPLRAKFMKITLPSMSSGITTGLILAMMISLSQYLPTLIIGGGAVRSLTGVMFPYISSGDIRTGSVYTVLFIVISFTTVASVDFFMKLLYNGGSEECQN